MERDKVSRHKEILSTPHLYMHRIDKSNYQTIRDQWETAAGEDEFEVVYAHAFDSMEKDLEKVGFNVPVHACMFEDDGSFPPGTDGDIEAVLELTDTKLGAMTKLATIRLAPQFVDWESDVSLREKVSEVYSRVLAHLITFGHHRAEAAQHCVKIYGRTNGLLQLLTEIATGWEEVAKLTPKFDSTARMEGRWLTINIKDLDAESK